MAAVYQFPVFEGGTYLVLILLLLIVWMPFAFVIRHESQSKIPRLVSAIFSTVSSFVLVSVLVLPIFSNCKLDQKSIKINGLFYSVEVPLSDIEFDKIERWEEPAVHLKRTNGIGVTGLNLGWYTNERNDDFFLFVVDNHAVVTRYE